MADSQQRQPTPPKQAWLRRPHRGDRNRHRINDIHHRDQRVKTHGSGSMVSATATDPLTAGIIAAAIEVHKESGPGLLEAIYEECLCMELAERHIPFERQKPLQLRYKGRKLDCELRIDLLVESSVACEIESVSELLPVHKAQLLTYMKLAGCETGLLLNFNVPVLKEGIKRMKL